jgi:putative Mn2+ efflux pump MntP
LGFGEIFLLGVGLSMDAFAVSICKGLALSKMDYMKAVLAGLYFGAFQMLMPLIGYVAGSQFRDFIVDIDHWIAFILLFLIGGNMIKESRESETDGNASFGIKIMLLLAIATSIDALAIGVTFAFLNVDIMLAVSLIGMTTFIFSFCGVKIGNVCGTKFKSGAEVTGGIILILIGTKILLEHLEIIKF